MAKAGDRHRLAVKALTPTWADVTVKAIHGADPVLVETDARPFELIDQAFREVEGRGVTATRSGGSIPIVPELGKAGAPVILSGIGLPDDRLHAPNEKINLDQVWKGVRVFGRTSPGSDPQRVGQGRSMGDIQEPNVVPLGQIGDGPGAGYNRQEGNERGASEKMGRG